VPWPDGSTLWIRKSTGTSKTTQQMVLKCPIYIRLIFFFSLQIVSPKTRFMWLSPVDIKVMQFWGWRRLGW
jgi:hypothetical protein